MLKLGPGARLCGMGGEICVISLNVLKFSIVTQVLKPKVKQIQRHHPQFYHMNHLKIYLKRLAEAFITYA